MLVNFRVLLFVTTLTTAQSVFKVLLEMYDYKTDISTDWDTESGDIITCSSHDCESPNRIWNYDF
jgi:hypothetical protein